MEFLISFLVAAFIIVLGLAFYFRRLDKLQKIDCDAIPGILKTQFGRVEQAVKVDDGKKHKQIKGILDKDDATFNDLKTAAGQMFAYIDDATLTREYRTLMNQFLIHEEANTAAEKKND